MSQTIISYPYDPTGIAATNLVTSTVVLPRVRNRAFAPDGGPFYKDSVKLFDTVTDELIPKTDYDCLFLYSRATQRTGQSVCGVINVHNADRYGALRAEVQVVGGEFSSNVSAIQQLLTTLEIDNRKIRFDDLIDVPVTMPPAPHLTYVGDLYGMESVVTALDEINTSNANASLELADLINQRFQSLVTQVRALDDDTDTNAEAIAILHSLIDNNSSALASDLAQIRERIRLDEVDLEQTDVRLTKLIANLQTFANQINAALNLVEGRVSSLETALTKLTREVGDILADLNALTANYNAHAANRTNPHAVTKLQVGLGNVQNYPVGSIAEIRLGTAARYVQASILKQYMDERISSVSGDVTAHINSKTNPHAVTATQVGLGNLSNFSIASIEEMRAGTVSRYVQASTLRTYINERIAALNKASVGLNNVENWGVGSLSQQRSGTASKYVSMEVNKQYMDERIGALTKSSVGLSQLQNWNIASIAEMRAGTASKYVQASVNKQYTDERINALDKSSVGLPSIYNWGVANITEMRSGTSARYVQADVSKQYLDERLNAVGGDVSGHVTNRANPHAVTAAQVGLSQLNNWAVGNLSEMRAGTGSRYVQVSTNKAYMDERILAVTGIINSHASNKSNPHSVTASQVGLSNLSNWTVATITEMRKGTASKYVQASVNKAYIDERIISVDSVIDTHTANRSNPHAVTKSQVGLNLVNNWTVASIAEMRAGTGNRYVQASVNKTYIDERLGALNSNSVGLGNVPNWTFASIEQMRAGTNSKFVIANINKQYIDERLNALTKSSVGLSNVQNYRVASEAEAKAGSSNSLYMTPSGVRAAIQAITSGGDEWELATADGGKWGILRNKSSMLALQWGQTFAMAHNEGCRCSFYRPFTGLPFAVVGSSHGWTSEPGEWAQTNEIYAQVVSKSIASTAFTASSGRTWGKGTDGVVLSWVAIGMVSSTATPNAGQIASRALPVSNYSSYAGTPSTVSDLVAPRPSSGGGGGTGPGNGCILPTVPLTLPDGSTILMEDLKVGDKLLGRGYGDMPDSTEPSWRQWTTESDDSISGTVTVKSITKDTFPDHYVINGTLAITQQHEIFMKRYGVWSWADVRYIQVGDSLMDAEGKLVTVDTLVHVKEPSVVYDIDVEELDTYIAGGYLVHNADPKQFEP